jgi:hypothetical protein
LKQLNFEIPYISGVLTATNLCNYSKLPTDYFAYQILDAAEQKFISVIKQNSAVSGLHSA